MKDYGLSHHELGRALITAAQPAVARIGASQSREWASMTFAGERHHYAIHLGGPEAETMARFMARSLSCDEFDLNGHIVADIVSTQPRIEGDEFVLDVEALTVQAV
jgi:hypothetical protein